MWTNPVIWRSLLPWNKIIKPDSLPIKVSSGLVIRLPFSNFVTACKTMTRILMANTLYYFNPDHDMAMANFTPYYKAPAEIKRMAADMSVLPAWYAGKGDWVKVDELKHIEEWESPLYPLDISWTENWISIPCSPWGWNPALVHSLQDVISSDFLPDEERLRQLRYLAGRQRCVEILQTFSNFSFTCGEARTCDSVAEVKRFMQSRGEVILKSPWSGSGRGLAHVSPSTWTTSIEGWISRIIRTQGTVMAEPFYSKEADFAMEFQVNEQGEACFAGYSLFETDSFGNYKANLLLPNEEIERRISAYIPITALHKVKEELTKILSALTGGYYVGYLGVDMMICRIEDVYKLHPCVEINLRMNMGVVARLLFERYVSRSSQGRYVTEHYRTDKEALDFHRMMSQKYPAQIVDNRLLDGYLSLTPVRSDTRFQAYMLVKNP